MKKFIFGIIRLFFPGFKYNHQSFSQDGEDMVLKAFYETQANYQGFYIDVGAHHPFRLSNTNYFYQKGWKGINIEPTPTLISAFHKHRKRDINLNIAIAGEKSKLTFYMFDEPALNSFDKELSEERANTTQYKIIKKSEIETFTLTEILDKYLPSNQTIDFLTIDVEGLDFEVLNSNNWNKYKPLYILVEQPFNPENLKQDKIYNFLVDKNYKLVARTLRTSIFQLN